MNPGEVNLGAALYLMSGQLNIFKATTIQDLPEGIRSLVLMLGLYENIVNLHLTLLNVRQCLLDDSVEEVTASVGPHRRPFVSVQP